MSDQHADLPLFRWAPPPVQIIPFPTSKRIGLIRRTAERIHQSRTQREADAIWQRTQDTAWRQMEKAGVDVCRIGTEVDILLASIRRELNRLGRQPSRPDGELA